MHEQRSKPWQERFVRSGYFFGALLFHLILFLMVATWVIFKAPPPPPTDVFHGVAVKVPPPPVQPPSSGAAANNPQFEPQPVVVPVVTPPSLITTVNSSAFKVDASKVMNQALSHLSDQMAQGTGLTSGGGGTSGTGTAFGSFTGTSNQLMGYFYDMKQTADRKPTGMTQKQWCLIMAKYIAQGWDDSLLAPYYKGQQALYIESFTISTRLSEEGPKAFGLENEVQPALWCVHYHGKVMAPKEGDYRFMGFGDDLMAVRINGALVLDAGTVSVSPKADVHQLLPNVWSKFYGHGAGPPYVPGMGPANCLLKMGSTFHMDAAKPVDMDVLIGDQGGSIAFFLLIEKVENTYETLPDGTPVIPFFQLNNGVAPTFSSNEEHPPYNMIPEPWTGAP